MAVFLSHLSLLKLSIYLYIIYKDRETVLITDVRGFQTNKKRPDGKYQAYIFHGGDLGIRTLAGLCTHYRFSRPTPSAAWVNLRKKWSSRLGLNQ